MYYSVSGSSKTGQPEKFVIVDKSSVAEITFAFKTVNVYNDINYINVFCDVYSDGKVSTAFNRIELYLNNKVVDIGYTNATTGFDLNSNYDDQELLNRAITLGSLAANYFYQIVPQNVTQVRPTVDYSVVIIQNPECTEDFCNQRGECCLIDVTLTCNCNSTFYGTNCQLTQNITD